MFDLTVYFCSRCPDVLRILEKYAWKNCVHSSPTNLLILLVFLNLVRRNYQTTRKTAQIENSQFLLDRVSGRNKNFSSMLKFLKSKDFIASSAVIMNVSSTYNKNETMHFSQLVLVTVNLFINEEKCLFLFSYLLLEENNQNQLEVYRLCS